MDFSSSELSAMVFKRIVRKDIGEFPLDHQMLSVFMELDGKAPLGAVARKTGLNMSSMREIIARLMKNGLVEQEEQKITTLDREFFEFLMAQLSLAVGPIAQVLIEDEVENLGYELSRFPGHRVTELIERLAQEIRREEKKDVFLKLMAAKIREKNYLPA
ncbi:MAG: helix-turn-helix domain-containing protein [Desulfobacterales bacterium]|jgi:DNA-binding MarR family transcriptional regulator